MDKYYKIFISQFSLAKSSSNIIFFFFDFLNTWISMQEVCWIEHDSPFFQWSNQDQEKNSPACQASLGCQPPQNTARGYNFDLRRRFRDFQVFVSAAEPAKGHLKCRGCGIRTLYLRKPEGTCSSASLLPRKLCK